MDEALFSATYVDNYIDSVENLPHDVQRQLTMIRDIDVQYRKLLREVDHCYDIWRLAQNGNEMAANKIVRCVGRMQQCLIRAQELGDEKMLIVNQLQELIDSKTRILHTNQHSLDIKDDTKNEDGMLPPPSSANNDDGYGNQMPQKRSRTQSPSRNNDHSSSNLPICQMNQNGGYGSNSSTGNVSGVISSSGIIGNNGAVDRTSNGVGGSSCAGGVMLSNGSSGGSGFINSNVDYQRSTGKRTRRRYDGLDLGGNESNSANESGNTGIKDKIINGLTDGLKTTDFGLGQRKGLGQNNASAIVGNSGGGGIGNGSGPSTSAIGSSAISSSSTGSTGSGGSIANNGKKKRRKARGSAAHANAREETSSADAIDPDEPTYCICNQISFGEMILCDNDLCPIEWFHFSCVSLVLKPKGKWYCPNCRGDRPNVMKPKSQFLKELVRYNKEKEDKT